MIVAQIVALLRARADSLEAGGNHLAAYEARNCALAVEREFGGESVDREEWAA